MAAPAQPTGSLVKFSRAAGLLRGAPAPQRRRAAAQRCDKDNTSTSFWGGDMSARSVDGWTRCRRPTGRRRRQPRSSARPTGKGEKSRGQVVHSVSDSCRMRPFARSPFAEDATARLPRTPSTCRRPGKLRLLAPAGATLLPPAGHQYLGPEVHGQRTGGWRRQRLREQRGAGGSEGGRGEGGDGLPPQVSPPNSAPRAASPPPV
jgi:hypothetical protein